MTSPASIREQLSSFNPVTAAQKDIKAVLEVYVNAEPQRPDNKILADIKQDLSVDLLYFDESIKGSIILFRLLRDYLSLKGFRYTSDNENQRIMFGLVNSFFDSESDKIYARKRLATMRSPITTGSSSDVMTIRTSNDNHDTKIAHNTATRFKKGDKFSGRLGEDINELIASYMEAAIDYELSASQKLRYFHNLFADDARRFYRTYVQPDSATFEEACIKMQTEYSSVARQNRIRKYLQNLSLASITEKKSCNVSEALEELRAVITKFAPQGPRTHRSEEDKVEYLYDATIAAEWAQNALTQCYTHTPPWNFQQIYTALDTAWLQHQHLKEKSSHRHESQKAAPSIQNILWERQGIYGIPKTKNSSSSVPRSNYFHSCPYRNVKRKCFNCNSPYHLMRDCKRPAKMAQKINALLKDKPKSAKHIPFEVCQQWEDLTTEDTQEMDSENDQSENEGQNTDEYTADEAITVQSKEENEETDYNELYF